jgi:DNA-binding response OmpR family regulator
MNKVLFVEDDSIIASGFTYTLQSEGYEVVYCPDRTSADAAIEQQDFSLAILDISLPDGDGFAVCEKIRQKNRTVPIIFLTAADDEGNTVKGLEMGADDYIAKPFRIREALARIKAVLRRYAIGANGSKGESESGRIKDITVFYHQAKVLKGQTEIPLTAMEYRLLLTFAKNKGRLLTRNQLLSDLWDDGGDYINDNTLSVYIRRLREKLEDHPHEPEIIKTIRGLGYQAGEADV